MSLKRKSAEEKQFVSDIIKTYRKLPSLWDAKSSEYNDRNKKAQAYKILLEKYKEKYPAAKKEDVTKKINILRSNFMRENNRLDELSKRGAEADDRNKPSLWYFNELSFIKDGSRNTITDVSQTQNKEKPAGKKSKKIRDPTDELITLASKRLKQKSDNFQKMADIWASKLRNMNSSQQIFAEKCINEILFEGAMGNLSRDSVQITHSASTPTHQGVPLNEHESTVDFICNQQNGTSSTALQPIEAYPVSICRMVQEFIPATPK